MAKTVGLNLELYYPGTPFPHEPPQDRMCLHPGQTSVYTCPSPNKVVVAGRGWGKSRYAAIDMVLKGLETRNWAGRRLGPEDAVLYLTDTFSHAKRMFWPILKMVAAPVTKATNENEGMLTLINDVRMYLAGADNEESIDRGRGLILRHAAVDEFADVPPLADEIVVGPAIMKTNGTRLYIGTPHRGKPHLGAKLEFAREQPVDEKYGFPLWSGFQFRSTENPWMDAGAIQQLASQMNAERAREELNAEILSQGGNFLQPEDWIMSPHEPADGYFVVACDLGGFVSIKGEKEKVRRDDTAIAVVKIFSKGWWVKEIIYGRWDSRVTATQIVQAAWKNNAVRVGIEKGALLNAIGPYLKDLMAQYGRTRMVEPLTHGNRHKEDRVMAALEGRLQRHRIFLNCSEHLAHNQRPEWVQTLIQQGMDFPSPFTKDDLLDALSYTDQLGGTPFFEYNPAKYDTWQPNDPIAGV